MVNGYAKTGQCPTRKVVNGGTRKLDRGYAKTGHRNDLQVLIYKGVDLQEDDLQHGSRRVRQHPCSVTFFVFNWGRVIQDCTKFKAIPCRKEADQQFILKVLAVTQATIPPWAVWDALEAVKQIGPRIPIALRTVRLPKTLASSEGFPVPATIGDLPPADRSATAESIIRALLAYTMQRPRRPRYDPRTLHADADGTSRPGWSIGSTSPCTPAQVRSAVLPAEVRHSRGNYHPGRDRATGDAWRSQDGYPADAVP